MAAVDAVEEGKALISELCSNLYAQGHVSGTGGGISVKVATTVGDFIVMAPSGVQKERMRAEDMFVLDGAGVVVHTPAARPPPYKPPKLSECAPLFMAVSSSGCGCGDQGPGSTSSMIRVWLTALKNNTAPPSSPRHS